jgi:hypothetical protein
MDIVSITKKIEDNLFLQNENPKSIAIKTNFLCEKDYPFSTSFDFFKKVIGQIRKKYSGQIFLIEPEFLGVSWAGQVGDKIDFLKENKIMLVQANKEKRLEIKVLGKFCLYIPKSWAEADIRVSISNAVVHRHHAKKTFWGGLNNIGLLFTRTNRDFSSLRRSMYESCLDPDYNAYINEVAGALKIHPVFSIVDAMKVGYSDEHSPVIREKFGNEYFGADFLAVETDKEAIKKLKIPNSYSIKL